MNKDLTVQIKTLTPIWTGGVYGNCDRLHETGIIGSLRWWYEAIVRGLGGYACDPTGDGACKLSGNEKNEEDRKVKLCPVCYLFGCTGWRRRFQLQIEVVPQVPLHFRTLSNINKRWLGEIFAGKNQCIDNLRVSYGNIEFRFIINENNTGEAYVKSQLTMLLNFIAAYGGLGAKLQHGFGQICQPEFQGDQETLHECIDKLKTKIIQNVFKSTGNQINTPYDLKKFVSLEYEIPKHKFTDFLNPNSHMGKPELNKEIKYIPCIFDLRYKGKGNWGMRQWLKGKTHEGWFESNNPAIQGLGTIDQLLGPRSKWKYNGKDKYIGDEDRMASRLYFGMPYRLKEGSYCLRVYGFAPDINISGQNMTSEFLTQVCRDYIQSVFKIDQPIRQFFGNELLFPEVIPE